MDPAIQTTCIGTDLGTDIHSSSGLHLIWFFNVHFFPFFYYLLSFLPSIISIYPPFDSSSLLFLSLLSSLSSFLVPYFCFPPSVNPFCYSPSLLVYFLISSLLCFLSSALYFSFLSLTFFVLLPRFFPSILFSTLLFLPPILPFSLSSILVFRLCSYFSSFPLSPRLSFPFLVIYLTEMKLHSTKFVSSFLLSFFYFYLFYFTALNLQNKFNILRGR